MPDVLGGFVAERVGPLLAVLRLARGLPARAWAQSTRGLRLYRVALRGDNCLVEDENGALEAYRFAATRWVRASGPQPAERVARALIAEELQYRGHEVGQGPELARIVVVEVRPAPWPEERFGQGHAIAWFRGTEGDDG